MPKAKMSENRKESKFHDIRETASDAVEIIRELGRPEVQATLDKVANLTDTAKEIMEKLKSPEWVENIDNFRRISQNLDAVSARIENSVKEIKSMEIVDHATAIAKTARTKMESFGDGDADGGGEIMTDVREVAASMKEMLESIKALVDEVKTTIEVTKKSSVAEDVRQTAKDVSSAVRMIRSEAKTASPMSEHVETVSATDTQ